MAQLSIITWPVSYWSLVWRVAGPNPNVVVDLRKRNHWTAFHMLTQ